MAHSPRVMRRGGQTRERSPKSPAARVCPALPKCLVRARIALSSAGFGVVRSFASIGWWLRNGVAILNPRFLLFVGRTPTCELE